MSVCVPVVVRTQTSRFAPGLLQLMKLPSARATSRFNASCPEVTTERISMLSPRLPVNVKQSSSAAAEIVPSVAGAPNPSAVHPTGLFVRWIDSA